MGNRDNRQGHRRPARISVKYLIEQYLNEVLVLQVATSAGNVPWVCTVCFAADSDFNVYWMSRHDARHSQEIARNAHVAAAVVLPYALGDATRGLQLAGTVDELSTEPAVSVGLGVMQERYGVTPERTAELKRTIVARSGDFGLYRLQPDSIVLYDKLNFPDAPQQRYTVRPHR